MNTITVQKISRLATADFSKAELLLDSETNYHPIDTINWKEFDYQPVIKFRIAHTSNEIWLKFYVNEKHIRAKETRTNGEVYKDSTVEFFISLDGRHYYNFEFNCIGTIHLAYGMGRDKRTFITPEVVEKIEIRSTLGNQPFDEKSGEFEWEMIICIPIECFAFDTLETFDGLIATANFYKCGDKTSLPHFVSWNPILTNTPDFHRPEYFGKLKFGKS